MAGGFGTPQGWYDEVMRAAARGGERFWQMPLVDEYMSDLEGWYGEIVNSGTAEGSLVKSGLFLREFATVPWVHLDIAGTAYFRKVMPYAPRGATGISHATLVELALAGAAQGGAADGGASKPQRAPRRTSSRAASSSARRARRRGIVGVVDERQLAGSREGSGCDRDAHPPHEGRRLTLDAPPILAVLFGAVGLVWGVISDRIAARWPAHEDGSIRPVDWRTWSPRSSARSRCSLSRSASPIPSTSCCSAATSWP